MLIGYARVSTGEQKLDLQTDALHRAGCERIFSDVASGSRDARDGLKAALDALGEGDTLVVWRLDRLGRSLRHLLATVTLLGERGVQFRSLTEGIDTSTSVGTLTFHIFAALAQFERALIQERTREGLKAAKARGRCGGRKRKLSEGQIEVARLLFEKKNLPVGEICETLGVSQATLYRYINGQRSEEAAGAPGA